MYFSRKVVSSFESCTKSDQRGIFVLVQLSGVDWDASQVEQICRSNIDGPCCRTFEFGYREACVRSAVLTSRETNQAELCLDAQSRLAAAFAVMQYAACFRACSTAFGVANQSETHMAAVDLKSFMSQTACYTTRCLLRYG